MPGVCCVADAVVAKDPDWGRLIKHRIAEGQRPEEISDEIYWIERYARARAHFSLAWYLRYHWPYSN
jgi:hypothetical protein